MEKRVFDLFEGKGECYLVGGCVRDKLLNRPTNDLDFATNLLPDDTEKLLREAGFHTYDVGKAFGTISFLLDNVKIEITTYRKNEKYVRDNRRPVVEFGQTINDDLIRRDFTFNALAMDKSGNIVDLFYGQKHLEAGVIDTPLDPEETFNDDPLRILRAVRFRARFGFQYSEEVKKALVSQAYRLLYLPKERIVEELNKILLGPFVKDVLNDLMNYKILNYVIPELAALKNLKQESKFHHKDVWTHTVDVVAGTPNDLTLRWAGLLHDIGKPCTFSNDSNGSVHFYRHEDVGHLLAKSVLSRLGLPADRSRDVAYLVREHMKANLYDSSWSDTAVRRFIRETEGYTDQLLALSEADITSHNPITVARHLEELNELKQRIETLKSFKKLECPVKGNLIMERFGLVQGPKVGQAKELIMNALVSGELKLGESDEVYLKFLEGKV